MTEEIRRLQSKLTSGKDNGVLYNQIFALSFDYFCKCTGARPIGETKVMHFGWRDRPFELRDITGTFEMHVPDLMANVRDDRNKTIINGKGLDIEEFVKFYKSKISED